MPKKDTAKAISANKALSIEDLYNILMEDIESELTTYNIPDLDFIYADEGMFKRRKRIKRYAKAFEQFTIRFSALLDMWKEELLAFRDSTIANLKEQTAAKEQEQLSDIERSIEDQ